ncbi:MAG: type II 3-dehydroquinate dehydratase [Gammaproteobacteria bacterium]
MANVLVLNGPNLDALGAREPAVYGTESLSTLVNRLTSQAKTGGHTLDAFQTDSESELVQRAKTCADHADFVLLNPAGFTHTSVPLRDAMAMSGVPFIEVHLSNPYAREPFRHRSLFSDLAVGVVAGFGDQSYELALEAALRWISAR